MPLPTDSASFDVLGVPITDLTFDAALELFSSLIFAPTRRAHTVFYVNAHTLNIASRDPEYAATLNTADYVFGDGTGVRWATRLIHRHTLRGNVNGTDMTPAILTAVAGRGLRYFLLGATREVVDRAASFARREFDDCTLVGHHHGYLDDHDPMTIAGIINTARPDLLLVGMGNPRQELWIARNKHLLEVPLCMGVGGLFTYWAGDLDRAPAWMRRIGFEWLHLLRRQPHKARRYVLGNPAFLVRVARQRMRSHDR